MKVCRKCNIEKDIILFGKYHKGKDGLNPWCKDCIKVKSDLYRSTSKGKDGRKKYAENNKAKISIHRKKYREDNIEKISLRDKNYNIKNRERIGISKKEYYKNNKEKIDKDQKKYRDSNRETARKYHTTYMKNRSESDILFKLSTNIRSLIRESIKRSGYKKGSKTELILGCSFNDIRKYLESKFEPWMMWENHGRYNGELNYGWDIDHIIPISSARTEEEVIRLNHYTNLQPLCSFVNRIMKRDKLDFF